MQPEIPLALFLTLYLSMSLPTCPSAQSQHPQELLLLALWLCCTHILNPSLPCLLTLLPDFRFPLLLATKPLPELFCYDLWLYFQATIFTCSLNYRCFQQMKHPSPGQSGLWNYHEMIHVVGFPTEHTPTQRKEVGLLLHCRLRRHFCSTKVPRCFSHEQLPRCKGPLSYVWTFHLL